MCPAEGTTRYDRISRSVIRLRFHTSLDQKRFLLHARKEKKSNCHQDKNEREVQVGLVTQLVVKLNLLETGRTLSRLRALTYILLKARSSSGGSQETWGGIESS